MSYIDDFIMATEDFLNTTKQTTAAQFLLKPSPESWSISEVIEHICISDKSAYIAIIKDNDIDASELKGVFQERIQYLLANADIKLEAPDAARPIGKFATLDEALTEFVKTRDRLVKKLENADLDVFATGFKHPRLGYLKRNEWIQFITWHSQHHLKQIKMALNTLNMS